VVKNPKGPTLTFEITDYSNSSDVVSYMQKNKKVNKVFSSTLQSAPLLIMNGFNEHKDKNDVYRIVQLMTQSMFPGIQVQSMNLSACKRVVLFNVETNEEGEEVVQFRHFGLSTRIRNVNRGIKKIVNKNKIPNLSKYDDIADFLLSKKRGSAGDGNMSAYSSESEIDDLPDSKIVLPSDFQGKKKDNTVSIRLHEIGPRMTLKLIKIEEGHCKGNVVYHRYIQLSSQEIKKQSDGIKSKRELKESRKSEQEANV
jgi:ribosome biogenesis protein SSF1/2